MPLTPTPVINYRIPPDNPYVGATTFNGAAVNSNQVRTEFYAVGLRNPWRFSFDRLTGVLYLADVGQNAREEIDIIQKGGNYGWAYREGLIARPGSPSPPAGFTHINPIHEYTHPANGASVTGGFVYRGSTLPALQGAYIFTDYINGQIWQLRYDTNTGTASGVAQIATQRFITCFGPDPSNGDVLMGVQQSNHIHRLVSAGASYATSNTFPGLVFTSPVVIVTPPGETNRLFIVEQAGRIAVITNLASPTRTVFMDISSRVQSGGEQGLLGLAFHPGYTTNRYFFVFYTTTTGTPDGTRHDRLSRFEISTANTNAGAPTSELILFQQRDEASNHNGGDVHFGPDGYLYVSLGDEGGANDQYSNSQTITKDFFAGLMRLDVDNRPGSLMPNPHPANTNSGPAVMIPPATLAETGAFADLSTLTPHPGIVPYDVNTPYWTDGAIKTRWFSISNLASRITFRGTQSWTFPVGTVWIQQLDLEMTNGVPESRRRIETRFLVRDSTTAQHYGVTYRWDSPTSAELVPAEGGEEVFEINDGGTLRTQTWRYPSRADCLSCHSGIPGRALGFNTPQLNRDFNYDGVVDNQIRALNNAGYFNGTLSNLHNLPVMASLDDTNSSLQHRVRSYLMANCAHCHHPFASTIGRFDTRIYSAFSTQRILDGSLISDLGNPSNAVVRAGSLAHSLAYVRMNSTAADRMPPRDTALVDQQAVNLFADWIMALTNYQTFAQWQLAHFDSTNAPNAAPLADPDADGASNQAEYYTGTDPNDPADVWEIDIARAGGGVSLTYTQTPHYRFEVQWSTNLASTSFWRFLDIPENRPTYPPAPRVHTVPDTIETAPIKAYRVRVSEP